MTTAPHGTGAGQQVVRSRVWAEGDMVAVLLCGLLIRWVDGMGR